MRRDISPQSETVLLQFNRKTMRHNITTLIFYSFLILMIIQTVFVEARPKRDLQALERIMREIVEVGTGNGAGYRPG